MHCVGWCLVHPGPILFGHIVAKAFNVLACNDCLQVASASQVYLVNGILDGLLQIIGKLAWSSFSRTWMMVVLVHSLDACNLAHKDVASVCTNLLSGWLCASFPNGLAPGQNLQLSKVESSLALRSIGKLGLLAGA